MKRFITLLFIMLVSGALFSQVRIYSRDSLLLWLKSSVEPSLIYKIGIVKGENVSYKVREDIDGLNLYVRNINNPDTTTWKFGDWEIYPPQYTDIKSQIEEIIHDCLPSNDLPSEFGIFLLRLRLNRDGTKILQVVDFMFSIHDPYWLNLPPDRLHEIEKAIVERVEIPEKLQDVFIKYDFFIMVDQAMVRNVEEARAARKKAIEAWKEKDYKVRIRKNLRTDLDEEINSFFDYSSED